MSETKKEKKMRQDLSWRVLPIGIFETSNSIELLIKQQEEDGYCLCFLNDKWIFLKKIK